VRVRVRVCVGGWDTGVTLTLQQCGRLSSPYATPTPRT
jgi:hypothetical protein